MVINHLYDVPYGGGYSQCRRVMYIDKHIGDYFTAYDGQQYAFKAVLVAHEYREIQWLKWVSKYNPAHRLSTVGDLVFMLWRGIPIDEYYGHLHAHVEASLRKWKRGDAVLPPDLDMLPYREDGLL